MPESEIKQRAESTVKRVIGALSALFFVDHTDPLTGNNVRRVLTATRGQEVEIPASEERRLEENGALLPKGSKPEDAQRIANEHLDAYRAVRGDQEALARHNQRVVDAANKGSGDVLNVDAPVDGPVAGLSDWIKENKPSADDTVALAEDDPGKAEKVLEAERLATGNTPRKPVEQRLQKIIDGA